MSKKRDSPKLGPEPIHPTQLWVAGLLALSIASLNTDCATLKRPWTPLRSRAMEKSKAQKSEVHELAIAPDVDVATGLDLGGGHKLYHSEHDLFYATGDRFYPIVVRSSPRLIGPSPDGKNVAFLEPFAFEMAADLYVFDVPALTLRRLTEHRDHSTTMSVKAARWFDNRTLYYLEGYRYGTVSRGGDLWRVDIVSRLRRPIVQVLRIEGGFEEIIEFEFVPDRKMIRYVVARYDELGSEVRQSYYCTLDGKAVK